MSLVPLGPRKFQQNKLFFSGGKKLKHWVRNFWRQQSSHEKKYEDIIMPSEYICNCKNSKKKKKKLWNSIYVEDSELDSDAEKDQ